MAHAMSRHDGSCAPDWLPSSMQRSAGPALPTIAFEEAVRRETEYRKRLEMTHPHLLLGLGGDPEMQRDVSTDAVSEVFKRKFTTESSVPQQQSSLGCATVQRQPANWYPLKKKVKVPQAPTPSQILQSARPNAVPSFWCKICKVDCVTEFNFGAHIGGKKHKAKKIEILGQRNTRRPATQTMVNGNPGQNDPAVSVSMSSSSTAGPSCDLSSGSRTKGAEERGFTGDL